jgi:hypothetical protein
LRFTNYEIYNNFEGVCETIEEKIRNRRNPPSPLYQGVIENPITQLYQERIENPPAKFCQEGIGENPPCPPLSRGKRKSAVSPFIMDEKFSYL